jgi:hypothetical protein
VRTIRQLGPILAAHFLQLLPANLAFNVPYFKLLDPGALAMQLLYSINNFIFALTILIIAVAMNA